MSKTPPKLPGRARPARRGAHASAFGELADSGRLRTVELDAIAPKPHQPRRTFDEGALNALASSIATRGLLQPPIVRTCGEAYELVAGERRCRAARLAGLTQIEVLISDVDDQGALQDALLENVARVDLSPVEAARAYAAAVEDLGITREELGRRVGQSRVSISNHLRLLDLPDSVLALLDEGCLTFAHGRALLLCDGPAIRSALARRAVDEGWSTRQLEDAAREAGAPRARPKAPEVSADAVAYAERLSGAISHATGLDLRARVNRAGEITITVGNQAAARALATKLGAPPGALDEPPVG